MISRLATLSAVSAAIFITGCTQETQNTIGRSIQNWTGTDGIIEIYAGDTLVKRFMNIDKLTTADGTTTGEARPYRFGYGNMDVNLDGVIEGDNEKKKLYFEFSDYSTSYIFYENPA